ncbi:EscU/YscU/HrcU family type III secretion system export apparatus switch protein [Gorillibacterium timonense]|uniref:EscU/YscU/HrcU family type III secretion system export apparatus switch protein n=1 Tax=Gorillibacterium timonense TaxID=1689269 RepID=UPI00071DABE8|nr:EscU/YscU/HrcU family type III secretion system export apparatus switch protein [Gorillibacterium timonense]
MMYKYFNPKAKSNASGKSAAVLRYDSGTDKAPVVIAQGKGHVARQIIEMAKMNDIPMQEDPLLVENLIDMDLGENVPPQLYSVIAEVLLMIEDMEKKA